MSQLKTYLFLLLSLFTIKTFAFEFTNCRNVIDSTKQADYTDTLRHYNLLEIDVVPQYQFKNKRQEKKYSKLEKDVVAAYPIVKIVESEFDKVNKEFESVYKTKAQKKKYMKWFEKHIYDSYIDTLKTLSIGQAKVLLTLIDRETGQSPYKLIKEYRGTGRAVMYRTGALLLGANLNATFDEEEDEMMAHIIRRIENGELMPIEIEERYNHAVFEKDLKDNVQ